MAVGQTEPLDAKQGQKRIWNHWILWAAAPQAVAAVMREVGAAEPDWKLLAAGGIAQGTATVWRELRETHGKLQTKGKMAWDIGVKLAATAAGWATFGLLW